MQETLLGLVHSPEGEEKVKIDIFIEDKGVKKKCYGQEGLQPQIHFVKSFAVRKIVCGKENSLR